MATFGTVLVANRAAVAARVIRALRLLRIRSVAVYSEADRDLPYLREADATIAIGAAAPRESYLNVERLVDAARAAGADALHPGYGFLSENAAFAAAVSAAGITFIGPSPRWIEAMGHKTNARALAATWGLPVGRGTTVLSDGDDDLIARAAAVGYPLMVKPAAGGGGIGMVRVDGSDRLADAITKARSAAQRGFGVGDVYLEALIERPRHVELQVLGDRHGNAMHFFDRDCSVQRRNQKVIEEAPAPHLAAATRLALANNAVDALAREGYDNIGTLELLLSAAGELSFLEMNTRLQVEHGVTEAITGVDLVCAQIRCAAGETLRAIFPDPVAAIGHAVEARVCAEDPRRFLPSTGTLCVFRPPALAGIRVDTGYAEGSTVTPYYDSLLAKVIAHAPTRGEAIDRLDAALAAFAIEGVKTNIPAVRAVLASDAFRGGDIHTGLLAECLEPAGPARSAA